MGMIQEFKSFAMRGNVVDMAVGIIMGGAFGTIVKSLVDDVIMPPIGYLSGNMDFKELTWTLRPEVTAVVNGKEEIASPAVTLNYGAFINNVITFLIIAWAVFMLVKAVNVARQRLGSDQPGAPPPPEDILLLRQIRDAVQKS
jgi:large conductance mechanosensitive channel